MRPQVTEHSVRDSVYELVAGRPGIHLREVARELDVNVNLADYHLRVLEKAGRVVPIEKGGKKGYFPSGDARSEKVPLGQSERRLLMLLRDMRTLAIVIFLLVTGGARTGEVAEEAKISPSTASHHLKRLSGEGVLVKDPSSQRYSVADPEGVARIVIDYRPGDEGIAESFASIWDEVREGI